MPVPYPALSLDVATYSGKIFPFPWVAYEARWGYSEPRHQIGSTTLSSWLNWGCMGQGQAPPPSGLGHPLACPTPPPRSISRCPPGVPVLALQGWSISQGEVKISRYPRRPPASSWWAMNSGQVMWPPSLQNLLGLDCECSVIEHFTLAWLAECLAGSSRFTSIRNAEPSVLGNKLMTRFLSNF